MRCMGYRTLATPCFRDMRGGAVATARVAAATARVAVAVVAAMAKVADAGESRVGRWEGGIQPPLR